MRISVAVRVCFFQMVRVLAVRDSTRSIITLPGVMETRLKEVSRAICILRTTIVPPRLTEGMKSG